MAQHELILDCIADTYVDSANPATNFASSTVLKVQRDQDSMLAILRFDFSLIPVRKNIISAILSIYQINSGQNFASIASPPESIDIDTITYNSRPYSLYSNLYNYIALTGTGLKQGSCIAAFLDAVSQGVDTLVLNPYSFVTEVSFNSTEAASNKPFLTITYEDVPPSVPTPTEPIGAYKDSKSIVRFEWQYNSDVGGLQKAFDLQWSVDQSTWTTVSETTVNNYYDMPADILLAGNIYWRVRTYNEYDEVSEYCDIQSFFAIGAPVAPALNTVPTNTARPVISWSAFNQQVYQLQVMSGDAIAYDSGVVPGINIRSHNVKTWLIDGEYVIKLRIKNEYDMWSDWGSLTVTISTIKPDKPSLILQRSAFGVELVSTGLVYRSDYDNDDYICIGVAAGVYHDNTVKSNTEYKYFVRAVSENDTFADSDVKIIQADFQHAFIAPTSDLTNIFVFTHGLNSPPIRTYNRQHGGASVMYSGRKHPVWEPSEHVNAGWAMTFYLETWDEVEAFIAIYDLNSTVLYRDAKGRKMYGTLNNLSVNDDILGYIISFTLNQVDYNEEMEV